MVRRALRVATASSQKKRLLNLRIDEEILSMIQVSLARRGLGQKGRSEWFRLAVIELEKLARQDSYSFLSSLEMYDSRGGEKTQFTLTGDALVAFESMLDIAKEGARDKTALITRLAIMAAYLQLVREGLAGFSSDIG